MSDATQRALDFIASCSDPHKLRQISRNAQRQGEEGVRRAAQLRLYKVLPSEKQGTLEYDVWQSIHALEGELTAERGKTTRLSRTRQKISRDGEARTVTDLVLGNVSAGFRMLIERDLPQLTFEAVALKHSGRFEKEVLTAASRRLSGEGYDPKAIA